MKDLFKGWDDISGKFRTAKKGFIFFDFDGTLAPIASRPEKAALADVIKINLRAISRKKNFILGIISGRRLKDIRKMTGVTGAIYAGNHGFEIKGPGIGHVNPEAKACRAALKEIMTILRRGLKKINGAFAEDKVYSLSVHYRLCSKGDVERVKDVVGRAAKKYSAAGRVKVTTGKKVFEIRPDTDWHKGRAVEWIVKKCAGSRVENCAVIYAGDDLTDEDAFKAVRKMKGITVLAGRGYPGTRAEYSVPSHAAMKSLVKKIAEI